MSDKVSTFRDLHVYQNAMRLAMEIFKLTKSFPNDEKFSLIDQVRRSSRSVPANIAEAWRKSRYQKAFVAKLSDAESEAAECQVWIEMAYRCGYATKEEMERLDTGYEHILSQIVLMVLNVNKWLIK